MLWHIPQPLDARGVEAHVGVEAVGDGAMDDPPLLFLKELDQLLLGVDVPSDTPVCVA
jgi:hypothetical protein